MNDGEEAQHQETNGQKELPLKMTENTPPTEPATGQQLEKAEQKIERRMSAFEQATIRLTRLGIFVGVLTAIIFAGQLYEMYEGGRQADKMIDAANRNAAAAKGFSDSAGSINTGMQGAVTQIQGAVGQLKTMANASGQSIRSTQTSIRLEQRAWIGITSIVGEMKAGQKFAVTITAKNTGRTPAQYAILRGRTEAVPGNNMPDLANLRPVRSVAVIYPDTSLWATTSPENNEIIPQSTFDAQTNGAITEYIFGRVDYEDVFGIKHWITFCDFLDRDAKTWHICRKGNDIDHNGLFVTGHTPQRSPNPN